MSVERRIARASRNPQGRAGVSPVADAAVGTAERWVCSVQEISIAPEHDEDHATPAGRADLLVQVKTSRPAS